MAGRAIHWLSEGFQMVNIGNPASPTEQERYSTPKPQRGLEPYIAGTDRGLHLPSLGPRYPPHAYLPRMER